MSYKYLYLLRAFFFWNFLFFAAPLVQSPPTRGASFHRDFNESYERARDIRANAAFTEQQLQIADNTSDDWRYNPESGKLSVNKEAMLRSKIRIETRQWQMARRHPQEWGDRQQIDVKNDLSALTVEERMRKAAELLDLVRAITGPRPQPPPIVYRPEEPEDEPVPSGGIGKA